MFKGLWAKLIAVLVGIVGVLSYVVKARGEKIDDLQHDARINDEIKSIHEKQEADRKEVLHNEPKKIKDELKNRRTSSKSDRFTRL